MADECDQSDDNIEAAIQKKIKEAQEAKSAIGYAGYCLCCGPDVPLPAPKRWCDAGCRDQWLEEHPQFS